MTRAAPTTDTIAAIATGRTQAGVAVIRVSGADALACVMRAFSPAGSERPFSLVPRRATLGFIVDPDDGHRIDEVLVVHFPAPRSYTGEDVVEVHAHGGVVVSTAILDLLCRQGARLAGPGEFTQRAFLNGKLDLAQAEAVADLIAAETRESVRVAAAQLGGALSDAVRRLRDAAMDVLAELEASIDFPDEDIKTASSERLAAQLSETLDGVRAILATADRGQVLREGVRVAIIGKPNVGKSSLLNALVGRHRAIVTDTPGTTRDVIEDVINLRGIPVRLSDTAGIRESSDPIEREGIERARATAESSQRVVVVLDTSSPLNNDDESLLRTADPSRTVIVLNKSDLPTQWGTQDLARHIEAQTPVVELSLKTMAGFEALVTTLEQSSSGGAADMEPMVSNIRHREALEAAATALNHAVDTLRRALPPELVAVDVHAAIHAFGLVLGDTVSEDVLDRIFSRFCIGK
ncbi:tRNA uridine-5-carboxymethylaminomethyl(34) synthesis GTPase MnmE [Candidatus Poribacteria bacterium]|nr:tRNA uridine-5-carboxymethylaminomethyl(34) synthesis GTPase MnmE [Candidatus Poribacteria bacterium]